MRYKSFRIRNFKGIKDATVEFDNFAGASVYAFVGLNESGKTTILEAIHTFSPDEATSELLGGEKDKGLPYRDRVPRHLISEFTGDILVEATIAIDPDDRAKISTYLKSTHGLTVDMGSIPDDIVMDRIQRFKDGDYVGSFFTLRTPILVKTVAQKKFRAPDAGKESNDIRSAFYMLTPDIAYFPTFIFDFPESFYLTERGDEIDQFYRSVFQDILDYDGRGHQIEKDIVRRIRRDEMITPWQAFWSAWGKHDDRDKIQHVMDRAGASVTKLVFGKWDQIFGEDTKGKEIVIVYDVEEGEKEDTNGQLIKTEEHDIVARFKIRDGTRRFDVNDRSLGFRWFFSFMLFTQFRVLGAESKKRPVLFLFDEPASNLHAAAQQKLIESFSAIASNKNVLAYSTHSHYMIEPKWLEQTFIVTNRSDDPGSSVLDDAALDDESLDIKVEKYRSFVNKNPSQTNYFQPILDRLEVVPSKFDMDKPSIAVEGKSDYYILRYALNLHPEISFSLLPGLGAGTLGALAALSIGWNLNFVFLLDSDAAGEKEKERYKEVFGVPAARLLTLGDILPDAKDIESLLDDEAKLAISNFTGLQTKPSKKQIHRFFQERLASDQLEELSPSFLTNTRVILQALGDRLSSFAY